MRRRPRPVVPSCVSWRDGLHLTGTSIWCDARRARAVGFASAADALERPGHGQLIASAETLALLGAGGEAHLGVPFGRPFTLGTVRLELVPSGHGRGGAALSADVGGRQVFYAGAHNLAGGGLGARGQLRPCDTLVVTVPWGEPHHQFGPHDVATARIVQGCQRRIADDEAVVLLVDDPLAGLELATILHAHDVAVGAHRAIVALARRLAEAGLAAPPLTRAVARRRALIWPIDERARLAATLRGVPARTMVASGQVTEPGVVDALIPAAGRDGLDAIAWSLAGDRPTMLELVRSSGASDVVLLGPGAEPLAAAIGPRARVLGPPRQMPLFAAVP